MAGGPNVFIKAPTENEVLAKIEQIADQTIRNALLSFFFWRVASQSVVSDRSSSDRRSS